MRVRLYKKTKDNRYYFQFLSDDGQAVLNSQGYTAQEARDSGLQSVIANAADPARYERLFSATGTPFFTIKAGNGQEIARSVDFETAAAMEVGIAGCMAKIPALVPGGGGNTATEPVGLHPGNNAAWDDYLPCERYNGGAEFHRFFNGEDESWYFGYNDNNGETLLRSEGYKSEKARENGIESVLKNAPLEERWVTGHDDAGFYYALRAGNHQEIAHSCYFGEEPAMLAKFAAAKTAFQPKAAARIVDDYLPCEAYAGGAGYYRFEKDGEYYFGYNDSNGHTILRSEGYKTESARENGIESVKKNAPIEERWLKATNEAGHYYFSLRAGNHQEIARTCYHETEAALLGVLRTAVGPLYVPPPPVPEVPAARIVDDYLPCEAYAGGAGYYRFEKDGEYYFGYNDSNGHTILRSEGYKTEAARENGIESVKKNAPIEERWVKATNEAGHYYFSLRAGNHQEIARTCYHETEAALLGVLRTAVGPLYVPPPPVPEVPAARIVDDYLPCEAYAGGAGYYRFEKDGEYYFGYNDSNGHTILRSEGYKTESARENGIESVKKNAPIEERWVKATNEAGHYYFSLRAGNHQEIARTCYHETEAALLGVLRTAVGPLYVPPPPVPPSPVLEAAAPAAIVVDDYLPCETYEGVAKDGFRRFKHEGNWYFAYNDKNGKPILRSEAYKSEKARENGIESVKRNRKIKEHWIKNKTDDGRYYYSLIAGNRQEIARSCYFEDEAGLLAAWGALPVFAALAAAAIPAAAAAVAAVPPPAAAAKPVAAPVAATPPKAAVPPPPVAANTGSGGFRWWWLLPLLLLLPLLFFLMRGCDGCKTTPPPPAETAVVPTPVPADTAKEETPAAPATPVETACACKGSENPILNIPEGAAPKLLRRLGTNPEFGNSHGLDGKAFFEKLTSQYNKSPRDKRFLDDLFKAMGYPNGFKDATASLFSEVTVPVGTVGNMGYSVEHKTLYAQVPDTERDRLAFHIKSANGCDMHFMKTCGNHFFFCPN